MRDWISDLAGPQYVDAVLWTLGALFVLVLVLVAVRLVRGLNSGTFVAGGRNRRPRLAVIDATAVDTHRRLVLVRRDDVEHLILIGGPTDVVVEPNIRLGVPQRRPTPIRPMEADLELDDLIRPTEPLARPEPAPSLAPREAEAPQRAQPVRTPAPPALPPRAPEAPEAPRRPVDVAPPQPQRSAPQAAPVPPPAARPVANPAPAQPGPRPATQVAAPPVAQPQAAPRSPAPVPAAQLPRRAVTPVAPPAAQAPRPEPRPAQPPAPAPARPAPQAAPMPAAAPAGRAPQPTEEVERDELDDALMNELEISIDEAERTDRKPMSLDDEMTRLLGELSGRNRR